MSTEQALEHDYVKLRRKVTGFLAGRYPQLDADAREDIYQDAWVALLEARARGHVAREKWISYLLSTAKNLGADALRCADRRRRVSYDPTGGAFLAVADTAETPEERVVSLDTGRELLGRLSPGECSVAIYRIVFGYDKREVCRALGLSARAYKRRVDRATVKAGKLRAGQDGGLTEYQERLFADSLWGRATPAQRAVAHRLLNTAAGRVTLARLRRDPRVMGRRPAPPRCHPSHDAAQRTRPPARAGTSGHAAAAP
jgi:DNA-directed RNA polymerase specialized sigma24 family protein